jgi:hypothetical protein
LIVRAPSIRTVAVTVGALLLAALVVANGFAAGLALAGNHGAAIGIVPRSEWVARKAEESFIAKRYDQAAAYSLEAIDRSPIDMIAMRVLGQTRLAKGDAEGGVAAMNMAARGGWRDTKTQLWVIEAALEDGDYETALQRIDGLFRRRELGAQLYAALRPALAIRDYRTMLLKQLHDRPDWRFLMLDDFRHAQPAEFDGIEAFFDEQARTPDRFGGDELTPFTERLLEVGLAARARRLWEQSVGPSGKSKNLIFDSGFTALSHRNDGGRGAPRFTWRLDERAGATIGSAPDGSGPALQLEANPRSRVTVATQVLVLNPGRYRLTTRVMGSGALSIAGYGFAVRCMPGSDLAITAEHYVPDRANAGVAIFEFAVPEGCPRQDLQVVGAPTAGTRGAIVYLDDVTLVSGT